MFAVRGALAKRGFPEDSTFRARGFGAKEHEIDPGRLHQGTSPNRE